MPATDTPTRTPRTALGDTIRTARMEQGLTQQALADLSGTTRAQVSVVESTRNLSTLWPALLDTMAEALDLDRDDLYAKANRIPPEIEDALRGNHDAISTVRKVLNV